MQKNLQHKNAELQQEDVMFLISVMERIMNAQWMSFDQYHLSAEELLGLVTLRRIAQEILLNALKMNTFHGILHVKQLVAHQTVFVWDIKQNASANNVRRMDTPPFFFFCFF
jgi:hypothetical protein